MGAATAIIVGCVGITPAGGYIAPGWAMALGVIVALPCYAVIMWRPRTRVDETLDVLAAHGIAGFTGILFIGFVAQAELERRSRRGPRSTASRRCWATRRWRRSSRRCTRSSATFILLKLIGVRSRRCG